MTPTPLRVGDGPGLRSQSMGLETMMGFETFEIARPVMQAAPGLWAYLDPGMGSMVLQVLLAGLLSSSFFLKSWARQLRDALGAGRVRKS
jgi:hypothetical protein